MKINKKFATGALATGLILGGGLTASADEVVTVEAGDTFWGIAQEYDADVYELMEDNADLEPTALQVGDEIEVDTDDDTHFVEAGDTLSGIAAEYGVTVDDPYEYNPGIEEEENNLQIGTSVTYGPGDDDEFDDYEEDDEFEDDDIEQDDDDELESDAELVEEDEEEDEIDE